MESATTATIDPRTITLATGRIVTVTRDNFEALAREHFAGEAAKGRAVDLAAYVDAFRRLAGLDGSFFSTGLGAAPAKPQGSAAAVLNNPFVRASDAIMGATPEPLRDVWQASSDATVAAAEKTKDGVVAAAGWIADLLGEIPAAANKANNTLRIVAIVAGLGALAVGAVYVTPLVRPLLRR
jgi:hypothetical protein